MKKYIGIVTFIGFTIAYIRGMGLFTPELNQSIKGIPHNYYHPDVWEDENPATIWRDEYPGAIYPPGKKGILYDTLFQRSIGDTVLIPIN